MQGEPKFFNDRGEIKATKNRLPHWEQDGCTYFITFRLADSLPKKLLDAWKEERRIWMALHLLLSLPVEVELSILMQRLKGGSSFEINQVMGRSGQLWAKDYFDRLIRDQSHFANCARYIRRNPVKAKLGGGAYSLVESELVRRILGGS